MGSERGRGGQFSVALSPCVTLSRFIKKGNRERGVSQSVYQDTMNGKI